MKRLLRIWFIALLAVAFGSLQISAQSVQNNSPANIMIDVDMSHDMWRIEATTMGKGNTLAEAKLTAYNNILSQMFSNPNQMPYSQSVEYKKGGVIMGEGADEIFANAEIQGTWYLKDREYRYLLKISMVKKASKDE